MWRQRPFATKHAVPQRWLSSTCRGGLHFSGCGALTTLLGWLCLSGCAFAVAALVVVVVVVVVVVIIVVIVILVVILVITAAAAAAATAATVVAGV